MTIGVCVLLLPASGVRADRVIGSSWTRNTISVVRSSSTWRYSQSGVSFSSVFDDCAGSSRMSNALSAVGFST